jgi:PhnB protein
MKALNSYLNFNGTTEQAFEFYKTVFDKEFSSLQRFSDTSMGEQLPEEDKRKIMHVALPLNDTITLMGTDTLESMGHKWVEGNNISLSLSCDSKEEADELFSRLSKNGTLTLPLDTTFWGAYFGMVTDMFGIQWMVNFEN